jgi:mannan endo-1,4-beta-mannosidase
LSKIKIILLFGLIFCCIIITNYHMKNEKLSTHIINGEVALSASYHEKDDYKKITSLNSRYNKYFDYAQGYKINYPNSMEIDFTLSAVKTVIADEELQIEIYVDDFENTVHSPLTYTVYSNKFLENNKTHIYEGEERLSIHGMETHLRKWHRSKLSKVDNDKNYYVSAEITKNKHEVFTIFIKSVKPLKEEDYLPLLNSFQCIRKKGLPQIYTVFNPVHKEFNAETAAFLDEYFSDNASLKWGIFEYSAPKSFDFLHSLEEKLDYTFEFLVKYVCFSSDGFPMDEIENAYENKRYVELTLQTMFEEGDNSDVLYAILNGKHDDFLQLYAEKIKEFNHPILFRLNNEMNGDWCVYSSYYASKDTEIFKEVWKYVYEIFEQNEVDNALWVWNPHDISFPDFKWNHYLNYYPGDEYVDIIGLTGYNTGTYYPGEKWREFNAIYIPLYEEYTTLFKKPLMITEFGSNSVGGDKISWIHEMFDTMGKFENIKVAIWWNGIDWDADKNPARIYRLDENENMIRTFEERLKDYK